MKTELKEVSPTRRELKIEIPAEDVKNAYNKVSKKYAAAVQVPGFRKGFAPVDIVKLRYKDDIQNEVLREILPQKVQQAIEENNLSPLGEPHLHLENQENLKLNGSEPLVANVHVEVMPEIPAPDYKNVEAVRRVRPVNDENIEQIIDERRRQSATLVPVEDRKSAEGDTLIVDLEGAFLDKPEEEPIKADDLEITLGDGRIAKAFTENLTGLSEDDEKEFTVEYPADFASPALAGKTVNYKAKVKSVGKIEMPETDDEWAKSLEEDFESIADLRSKLRGDLELAAKAEADNRVRDELVTKLIEKHDFEVPNTLVEIQARNLLNNFAQDLSKKGVDTKGLDENFVRMAYEQMFGQAERDVRGAMLLEKVAELENVEVSGDEIAAELEQIAKYYGVTAEQVRAQLSQQGGENGIADRLRSRKAVEALVNQSKITDGEWVDPSQGRTEVGDSGVVETEADKSKEEKKFQTEAGDSRTKKVEIQCLHCERWFQSPIYFGDSQSFDTSALEGNTVQCPFCGKMTGCNKDNMRVGFEDGGFIGDKIKPKTKKARKK
ncbi:MAG: trigger factor [Pyrinomonadaceae bacterium]